jgi:cell fate regulator YaaT (PSP1 superfamily)
MSNIDLCEPKTGLGTDIFDANKIIEKPPEKAIKAVSAKPALTLKQIQNDIKVSNTVKNFPSKIFINQDFYKKFNVSKAKDDFNIAGEVSELVEIAFKNKRKVLYQNNNLLPLLIYQYVVVEVESGIDIGTVTAFGKCAYAKLKLNYKDKEPVFSIIRHAKYDDMEKHKNNIDDVINVLEKTREYISKYELDMKVTDAEWQLDNQRLTIFFTAPQRIDFRLLVKDLARIFRTRIELRQISTRDDAKRIGGMGSCGRVLCCASFAHEHCHVTLEHAKTQQLPNNVSKLSGYCGRLKCCLLYEYANYIETFKNYPSMNSEIELPEGRAKILKADIFKELIYAYIPEASAYKTVTFKEFNELGDKGKVFQLPDDNGRVKEFRKIFIDPDESDLDELKQLEDEPIDSEEQK